MANPQIDKGHFTRIANEILDHITKTDLNGTQLRIVMAVWRFTYGFQRKQHEMSLSFLAKAVNTSRSHVDKELKVLVSRNIIKVIRIGARGSRVLSFNKNYEEWGERYPSSSQPTENENEPKKQPRKAKVTKIYDEDNTYYKMAVYFHNKITEVAKDAGVEHLIKKANLQKYADEFRKLIENDGVTKRLAKEVMDWVTQDPFWRTNILSASKLRKKFGELAIKMNAQKQQPKQQTKPIDPRDKDIAFQKWVQEGNDPNEFDWSN